MIERISCMLLASSHQLDYNDNAHITAPWTQIAYSIKNDSYIYILHSRLNCFGAMDRMNWRMSRTFRAFSLLSLFWLCFPASFPYLVCFACQCLSQLSASFTVLGNLNGRFIRATGHNTFYASHTFYI